LEHPVYAIRIEMDWKNDFNFISIGKLWFFWRKTCTQDVVSVKSFRFSISCFVRYTVKTFIIFFRKNFSPSFFFFFYFFVFSYWPHMRYLYIYIYAISYYILPLFFIKFQKHQTIRVPKSISIGCLRGYMGVTNN